LPDEVVFEKVDDRECIVNDNVFKDCDDTKDKEMYSWTFNCSPAKPP